MADPLPTSVLSFNMPRVVSSPGKTHHLIPIGGRFGGDLLDWTEETGHFDVWAQAQSNLSLGQGYESVPRTTGEFRTIRTGHALTYLAHQEGHRDLGNVLDLDTRTKDVRVYEMNRSITSGDPMSVKVNQSRFTTIGAGHELIYLDNDRVLDWEQAIGRLRVWNYDRTRPSTDPLPSKISESVWSSFVGHRLLYLGGDLILDWDPIGGDVRVWRYDRSVTGDDSDPLPTLEMSDTWAGWSYPSQVLLYVGDDNVLEWNSATGDMTLWDFDRPKMPDPQFSIMLAGDLATARTWMGAAVAALAGYQTGLITGLHDARWFVTDALIRLHFRAHGHPAGLLNTVTAIQTTFTRALDLLTTHTAVIRQISRAEALAEIASVDDYSHVLTFPGLSIHLTPSYRPFDKIGYPQGDGAGDRSRAARLVEAAVHFVTNSPTIARENLPEYATITPQQTMVNPPTYSVFAHHALTGQDLRFRQFPWH
jgi:hypothetical protein